LPDFITHDFIFNSAQCIVMILTGFLQLIEIDSKPSKVNFFKSGSNVNL